VSQHNFIVADVFPLRKVITTPVHPLCGSIKELQMIQALHGVLAHWIDHSYWHGYNE
jgi:hypothetical protein